jgi:hypothetical protein
MKARTRAAILSVDFLIVLFSFALAVGLKKSPAEHYFREYTLALGVFVMLWLVVSRYSRKFDSKRYRTLGKMNKRILLVNLFILGLATILMYGMREMTFSRTVVFATILITTTFELMVAYVHFYLKHAKETQEGPTSYARQKPLVTKEPKQKTYEPVTLDERSIKNGNPIDQELIREAGRDVYHFVRSHIDLQQGNYIIFSTTTRFNIERIPQQYYSNLVNLKRINDIRFVNKFMESVNARIPAGGVFVGCVETKELRKKRVLNKYPKGLNYLYYSIDFIVKRIFPKFNLTKRLYFFLTRGNNRVISMAETLGRLYSCGFTMREGKEINGHFYFAVEKIKEPAYDENPTYGPFVKLRRVGKNGKKIHVYKLRTMHPFSEYIQEYVYETNQLQNGGKFRDDFRVTTLGKIFRKFWIDELPMLVNLFKGEMKIIGVRPLSNHYFNLYSKELQEKRTQTKPGLIPPFYADMPETLEEIQESELKYLEAYEQHPVKTDWLYLRRAFTNIVLKKERSN